MLSNCKGAHIRWQAGVRTLSDLLAIWILLVGIMVTPSLAGAADYAGASVEERFNPFLPHDALWTLVAVDMATGKKLMRAGSAKNQLLVPGSLVKLVTTGAFLDHVAGNGKPDMRTTLSHDGIIRVNELQGNLYLTGRGNPLLSADDLRVQVRELSRRWIAKVDGDLIVDAALLDARGLERKRKGAAHASAGALGLDLHTVAIAVSPTTTGKPPAVKVEPPNDAVRMAVEARTVEAGASTLRITQLDDLSFSITGNIPVGVAPVRHRFPLKEPSLYAGGALRALLRERNIALTGEVRMGRTPPKTRQLAEIKSPDLDKLLRDMNVNSLNVVADNLLLILGGERFSPPGTREKGLRAVGEFLESLGLPADEARIADGSGLQEDNRVTAGFMAAYLQKAAAKPWFNGLYDSLPRAGMDGTLRDIGFNDRRFRAKTGSLENAFALAGYGVDKGGRKLAFTFIVNHPGSTVMDMKRAGAAVMRLLSTEVFQ